MFDKVLKYLSLISLAVFLLSYAYLDGYYRSFHINIIKYTTTYEIFFTLLPLVVLLLSSGFSIFQGSIPSSKKKVVSVNSAPQRKKWFDNHWVLIPIEIIALIGLLLNAKFFPYRAAPLVQILSLLILFTGIGYSANKNTIKTFGFSPYLGILSFILVGYLFIEYGKDLAKVNKVFGNIDNIQFKYHERLYKTDAKLIFVGETQSTIFIYHTADSNTWVIPRSNIDSLIVSAR